MNGQVNTQVWVDRLGLAITAALVVVMPLAVAVALVESL